MSTTYSLIGLTTSSLDFNEASATIVGRTCCQLVGKLLGLFGGFEEIFCVFITKESDDSVVNPDHSASLGVFGHSEDTCTAGDGAVSFNMLDRF